MTTKNYLKVLSVLLIFSAGIFTLSSFDKQEAKQEKQELALNVTGSNQPFAVATGEKCGTGKCGTDKKVKDSAKAKKSTKCGDGKCGADKKTAKKEGKCGADKKADKKAGKCGTDKKAAKKDKKAKCGTGKCGGN
jgi:uncharacterized low-complexity protein